MKAFFTVDCIYILVTLCIVTSCYKDIDLEKYKPSPKIVINSILSSDTVVMASVSRTWFFTEDNPNVILSEAKVKLYVNDLFCEELKYEAEVDKDNLNAKGMFVSSIIPKPGDKIKIIAKTIYGTSFAEDVLPVKIDLDKIELTYKDIPGPTSIIVDKNGELTERYDNLEISYHITFPRVQHGINYYFIRIEECDFRQPLGILDYSSDPVFTSQGGILDNTFSGIVLEGQGGRAFTDETIKDNKYTLTIKEVGSRTSNYDYGSILNRKICLYTLSHSYYRFLLSLQNLHDDNLMNNLADLGMAEPVLIYSNVSGGTGILGSCQFSYKIENLRSILPNYWE